MPIEIIEVTVEKYRELLLRGEGHFLDFKSRRIPPNWLTKTLSAFSNADGGELYIGIEDRGATDADRWNGFATA